MQQLLKDIDEILDISTSESEQLINVFKEFLDRNFNVDPLVMRSVFRFPANHFLNQQEDEDNYHTRLTEEVLY